MPVDRSLGLRLTGAGSIPMPVYRSISISHLHFREVSVVPARKINKHRSPDKCKGSPRARGVGHTFPFCPISQSVSSQGWGQPQPHEDSLSLSLEEASARGLKGWKLSEGHGPSHSLAVETVPELGKGLCKLGVLVHNLVTLALGRRKQENREFKASLGLLETLSQKREKKEWEKRKKPPPHFFFLKRLSW